MAKFRRRAKGKYIKKNKINEDITFSTVSVIIEEEAPKMMPIKDALFEARRLNLDLVLVSDNATKPTCKIIDYGKFLYEQKKKDNEQRKKTHKVEIKGIRLSLKIGENDLNTKLKQSIGFLEEKNMVKVSMSFRGRELGYVDTGMEKVIEFCKSLEEYGKKDGEIKRQGKQISIVLSPKKKNN